VLLEKGGLYVNRLFKRLPGAILILFSLVMMSACSTAPQVKQTAELAGVPGEAAETTGAESVYGWWDIHFKIYWSGADTTHEENGSGGNSDNTDDPPAWYMGPLLADRIMAPVIKQEGQNIFLWRFHRRAVSDEAGHQFSFIFYSTPEVAERVEAAVKANPLVDQLIEAGLLSEVGYPDVSVIDQPRVSDTSDQHWPDEIKSTWPVFIMGASEMWLKMTEDLADADPEAGEQMSVAEMSKLYQRVEEQLDTIWREDSRHAYFHHLNALFGYKRSLVGF
jgi:hypothetical protein